MFGVAPEFDQQWIPFVPNTAMDAFAVMEVAGATTVNGQLVVQTKTYMAGNPNKLLLINGPVAVSANGYGSAQTAQAVPVPAKGSGSAGSRVGPVHNSDSLSGGHPGFLVVGASPVSGTALVLRQVEATVCKGLLTADLNTTDETFTIDNVIALSGLDPVEDSSDTLTVQNLFSWEGTNNGQAMVIWNESETQWEAQQVECP